MVFDEAQHLSIACLETLRELLDQPPHCGLLFAGTHELEEIFTRQALELEQWRSRFHAGQALPGISDYQQLSGSLNNPYRNGQFSRAHRIDRIPACIEEF